MTPTFLDTRAQAKFAELSTLHKFAPDQIDQLAAYCASYSRWVAAEEWLCDPRYDADGHPTRGPVATILDDKGNIKTILASPQIAIAERAVKEMARIAKLLKLTRHAQAEPEEDG